MVHSIQKWGLQLLMVVAVSLLVTASEVSADPALQDGLIANWSFDDGSGTTVTDTQAGANGTLVGSGTTWTSGLLGSALTVDNSSADSGILIGSPASLSPGTNARTYMTWLNMPELPSAGTGFQAIFDSLLDNYALYVVPSLGTIRHKVEVADASNNYVGYARIDAHESHFSAGTWHQFVTTFDGTYAKIYCDGQLVDTTGISVVGAKVMEGQYAGISYQPDDPNDAEDADSFHYSCTYDETAMWSRALNANEISYLYNGGSGRSVTATNPVIAAPAPTPVVHYKFENNVTNSGSGSSAYDGTIVDGVNGSTNYEAGKAGFGQGLRLTNVTTDTSGGDFVSTPYTMTKAGTIAFWIKPDSYYNWVSLFDNSGSASSTNPKNDWEMWIYEDGRLRWRLNNDSSNDDIIKDLDEVEAIDGFYHIAVSWCYDEALGGGDANITMFVNGEYIGRDEGNWIDPGDTFFIGGGNDENTYGNGVYDDFRIYDVVLNADEIQGLLTPDNVAIPGDTNGDKIVNEADATVVAGNWGSTVTAGDYTAGDFNGDGIVNAADASIMAAQWGDHNEGANGGAVPEPCMLTLLSFGVLSLLAVRRRRQ